MDKYSPEVMEIHNKFNTASDDLLKKAEDILARQVSTNGEKNERLAALGFGKTKDQTVIENDKKEKDYQKKLIEAINHFRVRFPNYKFIPEKTAEKICKKHKLILGDVTQYTGFVPDKNLMDIERFFELHPDSKTIYYKNDEDKNSNDSGYLGILSRLYGHTKTVISKGEYEEILAKENAGLKVKENQFVAGVDPIASTRSQRFTDMYDRYLTSQLNYYRDFMPSLSQYGSGSKVSKVDAKLKICAPKAHMNMQGYELKNGYKAVWDPIVSLEVEHANGIKGLIIITAWGDEASDPLVVNQNNN
jgi:hypothetical protein